jgi:hypothetical protein
VIRSAVVVAFLAGCSLSTSSEMGSDSSESSESSSRSSASLAKKVAYRDDVRAQTAAFVTTGGDTEAFEKRLGTLAREYGITNWEDERLTYLAIGAGLAEARVPEEEFDAFRRLFARADAGRMDAILEGFRAAR